MNVYFDENFSPYLVQALQALENSDGRLTIHSTKLIMPGAKDEDVIRLVASNNGVLFTRDTDFHKQKMLRDIIVKNHVGLVYYSIKNDNFWSQVKYIMYNWEQLRSQIISKKKTFACRIVRDGKGKSKIEKKTFQ